MVASVRRRRTPRRSIKVRGSAGRTTEVVREADADKARAGALGGSKHSVRGTIRGAVGAQLLPESAHPVRWVRSRRYAKGGRPGPCTPGLPPFRSTEVVREADAGKARAGALGGPKATGTEHDPRCVRRSDAGGERSGRVSYLPPPHSLPAGSPAAWAGGGGLPRGFSTVSTRGQADAQGGQGLRTERS
jgi:hypothetical protein